MKQKLIFYSLLCFSTLGQAFSQHQKDKDIKLLRESNALMIEKLFDLESELESLKTIKASSVEEEDFFDKISVTGEIRHRFENKGFRSNFLPSDQSFINQRASLSLSGEIRDSVYLNTRLLDTKNWGSNRGLTTNNQENYTGFDLFSLSFSDLAKNADIIIGRQVLSYGDGLVLGYDSWDNRPNTFDAISVNQYRGRTGEMLQYFYSKASNGNTFYKGSKDDIDLGGIYATFIPNQDSRISPYAILSRDHSILHRRNQFGVEGEYQRRKMHYDAHFAMQTGNIFNSSISADFFRLEATYQSQSKKSHEIYTSYLSASGDKNPASSKSKTFKPIYPKSHGLTSIADHFELANLNSFNLGTNLKPTETSRLNFQLANLSLDSASDFIYNNYGLVSLNLASNLKNLGTEYSFQYANDLRNDLELFIGYSYFNASRLVRAYLPGLDSANYLYMGSNFNF